MSTPHTDFLDTITLSGLRCFGHHGVFDFEREQGQEFIVDIVCTLDCSPAAASDEVTDTLHYGELAELANEIVTGQPRNLIETVAAEIARTAMRQFPLLHSIAVTIHKPQAPIPLNFADVSVTARRQRTRAVLSIGANLGAREAALRSVVDHFGEDVLAVSPLYATPPWGNENQPDFLNAALIVNTYLSPRELLAECQALEHAAARVRDEHWGPRTLDVDIVHIDGYSSKDPILTVPHPYAHSRLFVLLPWYDIDPTATIGETPITELIAAFPQAERQMLRVVGAL